MATNKTFHNILEVLVSSSEIRNTEKLKEGKLRKNSSKSLYQ